MPGPTGKERVYEYPPEIRPDRGHRLRHAAFQRHRRARRHFRAEFKDGDVLEKYGVDVCGGYTIEYYE
ncbi:MAG: hypothetical protein P8X76_01305 [Maritimibacter sp.]